MNRLPIRIRVTAAFAIAMAVVLSGSGLFLYARLGSHLSLALDRELRLRTQDLAELVRQPQATLNGETGTRLIERGESYAQLLDEGGHVIDATRPLGRARLLPPDRLHAAATGPVYADLASVPGLNEPSRILATPVRRAGHPYVLIVGATLQDRAETLAGLRDELLIAGPSALLLASLIGYVLAGISLRQVDSMRRRAAQISAETPDTRLPVPRTGDELERLGRTLNEMLDRLQAALERERSFVADAGHELRTPLALFRTELELALRHAGTVEELKDAVRRAAQESERLSQLAEALLLIARIDRGRLPLRYEEFSVEELFTRLIDRFQWRAREADVAIQAKPTDLRIHGDRLRIEQALGNLIDNSLRYGGDSIRLSATARAGRAELHVTDCGSGFAPEFRQRAFERFSRGDPARGRGGTGLGLAIVHAIGVAHGGTATARNPPTGGADVWIELPIEASDARGADDRIGGETCEQAEQEPVGE